MNISDNQLPFGEVLVINFFARNIDRFFINSTFICKLTNAINHLISPPEYYKPCTIVHGQVNWTILFFSQSITRM